ncbi:MAG: alpha/beta hydrolase [Holophagales bacterium]|nr:alpha/beta hydrolase [Holophagales bacterium]
MTSSTIERADASAGGDADGPLAHQLRGDRERLVLLLNGGMMTLAAWEHLAGGLLEPSPGEEAAGDSYGVLGCDFRGQLLSPGMAHPHLDAHAADVVHLLDHLELEAVHVLGTSFGGEVAALLAARHPRRVRSLAMVTAADRTPPGMEENARELAALARQVAAGGDPGPFHDALMRDVYSPEYLEANAAELAERRARALPAAWYEGLLGILRSVAHFDLGPELGRIACPTLVVHAAGDAVMPEPRVKALAAAISGAELAVHPTSGHALVSEDPAWLLHTYRRFLARLAGPAGGTA